jgi:hypothetical protein
MKRFWLLGLLLVSGLIWGQGTGWAKRYSDQKDGRQRVVAGKDATEDNRWQKLTPGQRKELKQRYRQFQELPPAEQEKLRKRYERYQELSPEKKRRMQERHQRLQKMTPKQREELKRELQRIKQLSPEDRHQQRQKLHKQYFNGRNDR